MVVILTTLTTTPAPTPTPVPNAPETAMFWRPSGALALTLMPPTPTPDEMTCAPDPIVALVVKVITATPTEPAMLVLDLTPPAAAAPTTVKSL